MSATYDYQMKRPANSRPTSVREKITQKMTMNTTKTWILAAILAICGIASCGNDDNVVKNRDLLDELSLIHI